MGFGVYLEAETQAGKGIPPIEPVSGCWGGVGLNPTHIFSRILKTLPLRGHTAAKQQ